MKSTITNTQLENLKKIGYTQEGTELPALHEVRDWFAENDHENFENLYILPETEMYEPGFQCCIWVKRPLGYMPFRRVKGSMTSSYNEALSLGIDEAIRLASKKCTEYGKF